MTAAQLTLSMARGLQCSVFNAWSRHSYHLLDSYIPEPAAIAHRTVAHRLTNVRPVCALSEGADGIYEYVFRRREAFTLAAWSSGPAAGASLAVPVEADRVALWDLMGNPVATAVSDGCVQLALEASPQFLEGVAPSHANRGWALQSGDTRGPDPRHPRLWMSFHHPRGSEVFPLPRGTTRRLALRVHREGPDPAIGTLAARWRSGRLRIWPQSIEVTVPA